MTWWKVKLGDPDEDHTIELYNAHWRQEENCKDVIDIGEERQIGEEDQDDQDQEKVEEGSDEDWGNEVEAYSRRGGLGVR